MLAVSSLVSYGFDRLEPARPVASICNCSGVPGVDGICDAPIVGGSARVGATLGSFMNGAASFTSSPSLNIKDNASKLNLSAVQAKVLVK